MEINPPIKNRDNTYKPNVRLEALMCLTYLLKNHGNMIADEIRMYNLINDIFFAGFNDEVITCLSAISRIKNKAYKQACQIKLLNTCSIVLT